MDKLKDKLVLIVDDDDRNTFALGSYLEILGMKVEVTRNGEDALSTLRDGLPFDVILLDMMMPVLDGYETLNILRNDSDLNHIPVIAITARAMKGDKEKCLDAGAWDYIAKPLDMSIVVDKLMHWIK